MRPSVDEWAMSLAVATAKRSTCARRLVGCVLLDSRNHVMATGYNGVASGQPHCRDRVLGSYPNACPGAFAPSGTMLDGCHAIHAEQNALLQCRNVYTVETAYCTTSPCMTCLKLLLGTTCKRIVILEPYPNLEAARDLWLSANGRSWADLGVQMREKYPLNHRV